MRTIMSDKDQTSAPNGQPVPAKAEKPSALYLIQLRSLVWSSKPAHEKFLSTAPKTLKDSVPLPPRKFRP